MFSLAAMLFSKSLLLLLVTLLVVVQYSSANVSEESTFTSSEYYEDVSVPVPPPAVKLDFVYHNYTALTNYLKDINAKYPTLTHLYSIGKSVRGLFPFSSSHFIDSHPKRRTQFVFVLLIFNVYLFLDRFRT